MSSQNALLSASARDPTLFRRIGQALRDPVGPNSASAIALTTQLGALGWGLSKAYDFISSQNLDDEEGYGKNGSKRVAWQADQNSNDLAKVRPTINTPGLFSGDRGNYVNNPSKSEHRGPKPSVSKPEASILPIFTPPHESGELIPSVNQKEVPPILKMPVVPSISGPTIEEKWDVTGKVRNKTAHAANGNMSDRAPVRRKSKSTKVWRRVGRKAPARASTHKRRVSIVRVKARPGRMLATSKPREITRERAIAQKYNTFLRNPVSPPPRIGSSGSAMTKILHGYYKNTFSMAAVTVGNGLVTEVDNATEFFAYLSPTIIATYASATSWNAPIVIGVATSSGVIFSTNNSTASFGAINFANSTGLAAELGTGSSTRWMGGHISLECKCSMVATAQPYAYGGLLPMAAENPVANTAPPNYTAGQSLIVLNGLQLRDLTSSVDAPGMNVSTVYVPADANALVFNNINTTTNSVNNTACAAVPMVGMTGCPTGTTITLTVSGYWEVLATQNNMSYSGWAPGPKVSAEDVYDNLSRFTPVSTKVRGTGARINTSQSSIMAMIEANKPSIPVPTPLQLLSEKIDALYLSLDLKQDDDSEDDCFASELNTISGPMPNTDYSFVYEGVALLNLTPAQAVLKGYVHSPNGLWYIRHKLKTVDLLQAKVLSNLAVKYDELETVLSRSHLGVSDVVIDVAVKLKSGHYVLVVPTSSTERILSTHVHPDYVSTHTNDDNPAIDSSVHDSDAENLSHSTLDLAHAINNISKLMPANLKRAVRNSTLHQTTTNIITTIPSPTTTITLP